MKRPEFYFKEPRLQMTTAGRFAVRLVSYFVYGVLLTTCVMFVFSDILRLQAAGILLVLFFLDRLVHLSRSERTLARLSLRHANLRCYMLPKTYTSLEQAYERVLLSGGNFSLHLLSELAKRPEIRRALVRMDVKPEALTTKLDEYLKAASNERPTKVEVLKSIEQIVLAALPFAKSSYAPAIEPRHIFTAISHSGSEYVNRLLTLFEIAPDDLAAAIAFGQSPAFNLAGFLPRQFKLRTRTMNRAWTARPTPNLDSHSRDLTALAKAGQSGFLIGHEKEYGRLIDVLARPGRPNALLLGEAGAGKDTVVNHLAFAMAHDRVPKPLFDRRLVELSISSVLSGAATGEIEKRLQTIVREIISAKNIVLYIPDIHQLAKAAAAGSVSAADILLPTFREGYFSVIGATSPREYKQWIEPNSDFAGSFEEINIQELSEAEAVRYLVYQSLLLERPHNLTISFSAVKQAVKLARKYFRQTLLPGSAEDLLKEAIAKAVREEKKVLTAEEIISAAEGRTNVPIHAARPQEAKQLLNLETEIHKQFIDQEEAVKAVSQALREYRSGLSRVGGPIATFLFVGPTGVGKTELSKVLTKLQFGSVDFMTRFDMTEYQDKQSFMRFIGSPDGSVRGALTDAVSEKPYSLILLDEFEKAHPDILNLFLQVFDDGRLTDGLGKTVDFQNTIIIATSNAHSILIKEEVEKGTGMSEIAEILKKRLTEFFKPELINRFSKVVVFRTLSPEHIQAITKLKLQELAKTLLAAQGIACTFHDSALAAVARLGYDPVFGARPLRGVISEKLNSIFAEKILGGELKRGANVRVSYQGDQFVFTAV